jgi:anti-anti-sigma factor
MFDRVRTVVVPVMTDDAALDIHRHERCTVIRCTGRLVLGRNAERLEQIGLEELAQGRRIVLDLIAVHQVDARGLGAIAELSAKGQDANLPVIILGADARTQRLLDMTRVASVLDALPSSIHASVGGSAVC